MKGTYFEYETNIFKILGYSSYDETILVELVKQNKELCVDANHAAWLSEGKMWTSYFFEEAKIIPNGHLVYGKE